MLAVFQQRKLRMKSAAELTADRIRRLDELGFNWSNKQKFHVSWDTRYQELAEFKVSAKKRPLESSEAAHQRLSHHHHHAHTTRTSMAIRWCLYIGR